jgi:hypothetical protein
VVNFRAETAKAEMRRRFERVRTMYAVGAVSSLTEAFAEMEKPSGKGRVIETHCDMISDPDPPRESPGEGFPPRR